jgi:hypothetical protein
LDLSDGDELVIARARDAVAGLNLLGGDSLVGHESSLQGREYGAVESVDGRMDAAALVAQN